MAGRTTGQRLPPELEAPELTSSVALHVALPARIDLDRVAVAFTSDLDWFGEPLPPAASGTRLFACDLERSVRGVGSR